MAEEIYHSKENAGENLVIHEIIVWIDRDGEEGYFKQFGKPFNNEVLALIIEDNKQNRCLWHLQYSEQTACITKHYLLL